MGHSLGRSPVKFSHAAKFHSVRAFSLRLSVRPEGKKIFFSGPDGMGPRLAERWKRVTVMREKIFFFSGPNCVSEGKCVAPVTLWRTGKFCWSTQFAVAPTVVGTHGDNEVPQSWSVTGEIFPHTKVSEVPHIFAQTHCWSCGPRRKKILFPQLVTRPGRTTRTESPKKIFFP